MSGTGQNNIDDQSLNKKLQNQSDYGYKLPDAQSRPEDSSHGAHTNLNIQIGSSKAHSPMVTISPDQGMISHKHVNNSYGISQQLTAPGDSHTLQMARHRNNQSVEYSTPQNSYLRSKKGSMPQPMRNGNQDIFDNSLSVNNMPQINNQ